MYTKEPLDNTHEVDFTSFRKEPAEKGLNGGISREINKIVNAHPKR
jgi:hypothetical protein